MTWRNAVAAAVVGVGCLFISRAALAATGTLDIDVDKPGVAIPGSFYGLMTEEINHSYDGGLFAELVRNRTFQDPLPRGRRGQAGAGAGAGAGVPDWALVQADGGGAKMVLEKSDPVTPALPVSLRLDLAGGKAGIANEGYWGIPVWADTKYAASFYAKGGSGFSGAVTAAIVADDGKVIASGESAPVTGAWKKYSLTLTSAHDAATTAKAKFVLSATGKGSVSFSLVSLFPPTYMDTPGGLRPDLMKLMADMHPAFVRLPGGNYVEGDTFPTRFDWKKMIGPDEQRPGHMGCWGYRSSDGFGMPQYLLWCKQLGAEPVLALFAGYTLNHDHVNAGPDMQKYVDEALQEIEYVSGPADSEWGKKRAADGLAEPFALHYVEVGNEDWFDRSGSYDGRFTQMFKAIRAKYPKLKIIATAPVKSVTPDLYDDHYYRSAREMAFDGHHYDVRANKNEAMAYDGGHWSGGDRDGPLTFVGEWATQEGKPTPDLNAGLADAAWLMGLERNSDQVPIECYAPLFVNVNPGASQWGTNLIGYDALHSFGSPSYYAQAMLGQNKGDTVLPAELKVGEKTAATEPVAHGGIGIGTWHTAVEYKDIEVTTPEGKTALKPDLTKDLSGWNFSGDKWQAQDGTVKPTVPNDSNWATTGDASWTDYTVKLKARKTGGDEGFLILWHVVDEDNYCWWNVGGWGNSRTQCEAGEGGGRTAYGPTSNFKVETGKWYSLRLEVSGRHVRCFVDDKLITDATEQSRPKGTPIFASASYVTPSHEVIVKVVNMENDSLDATINLRGVGAVTAGRAIVLSGEPKDVNTVDEPTKVAPKEETLTDAAASFHRTFPAHSLTLLRMGATAK